MRARIDWDGGPRTTQADAAVRALRLAVDTPATRRAALAEFAGGWRCAGVRPAIGADAGGAPLALGLAPEVFVSLGHREGALALAVADRPVGVDVEPLETPEAPAWNVLHAGERAALTPLDAAARHCQFLTIWTAKEAYLKALRAGLSREPAEIESRHAQDGAFTVHDPRREGGGFGETRVVTVGGRRFLIGVALLG